MNQWVENLYINYRNVDANPRMKDFFVHSHYDYFEVNIFHHGNCSYLINNEPYQLEENDVLLINGAAIHSPLSSEEGPYDRTVIKFSSDWIHPILEEWNLLDILTPFTKQSNLLLKTINHRKMKELHDIVNKLYLKRNNLRKMDKRLIEEETILLLQLLYIIYDLSNQHSKQRVVTAKFRNGHVKKIISWVDDHYSQSFTLNDIASSLHLSKYYMARIFKDTTGLTIMEYVMQRRLWRARHLLESQPHKSILEIAMEAGFESASHFSRRFRKYFDVTPSAYRNGGCSKGEYSIASWPKS